jgi:outer membrane biosynthesis protein TonB
VALSDEQNAMLRLLASGEQGYDDIAALMGLSVTEVRAKVVGALAQLEAEGKPVPNVPSPVPGGAKPAAETAPTAPEAVPEPPADEPAPTPKSAEAPSEPEPGIAEPTPPKAAAAATPPPSPPPSGGRTITLPSGRGAWLLGGGVAAIVVIVVVILLVSGGSSDNSSSTSSGSTTPSAETGANENAAENEAGSESTTGTKQPTVAKLVAVDGSEAEGQATFGRIKHKLALAIEATGLEPTTAGTSYTVWLAQSPTKMLPLASTAVKASGKGAGDIAAEFEVPVEVLAYLANGTFAELAITRTDEAQLHAAIKLAKKEKTTPAYTGEEVLHGQITGPIVGLAIREKEVKAE